LQWLDSKQHSIDTLTHTHLYTHTHTHTHAHAHTHTLLAQDIARRLDDEYRSNDRMRAQREQDERRVSDLEYRWGWACGYCCAIAIIDVRHDGFKTRGASQTWSTGGARNDCLLYYYLPAYSYIYPPSHPLAHLPKPQLWNGCSVMGSDGRFGDSTPHL